MSHGRLNPPTLWLSRQPPQLYGTRYYRFNSFPINQYLNYFFSCDLILIKIKKTYNLNLLFNPLLLITPLLLDDKHFFLFQVQREDDWRGKARSRGSLEKPRKQLAELEAQLVLASPHLLFQVNRMFKKSCPFVYSE